MTSGNIATDADTGATSSAQKHSMIAIGGGSAGPALAAQLCEEPSGQVLSLDVGPNFSPDAYPSSLTEASVVAPPHFDWQHTSDDKVTLGQDILSAPHSKLIGGSSTFKALAHTPSDDRQRHGRNGPFSMRQRALAALS